MLMIRNSRCKSCASCVIVDGSEYCYCLQYHSKKVVCPFHKKVEDEKNELRRISELLGYENLNDYLNDLMVITDDRFYKRFLDDEE